MSPTFNTMGFGSITIYLSDPDPSDTDEQKMFCDISTNSVAFCRGKGEWLRHRNPTNR